MTLVADWLAFCEGDVDFDESHFLTLFHAEHDAETLSAIFKYFPSSSELSARMQKLMSARRKRMTKSVDRMPASRLLELAAQDLKNKASILENLGEGELAQFAMGNRPRITDDLSEFMAVARNDWPNCEMKVVVGDYILDHWKLEDHKAFALFEALYGAANSYDIQYFLAAPLIDTDLDFDLYFELWKSGADAALGEDAILVFRNKNLLERVG